MNGQDTIHLQIKTIITWITLSEDHDADFIKLWISIHGDDTDLEVASRPYGVLLVYYEDDYYKHISRGKGNH